MRKIAIPGMVMLAAVFGAAATAAAVPAHPSLHARSSRGTGGVATIATVTPASAGKASAVPAKHMLFDISCTAAKSCAAAGLDVTTDKPLAETWNGAKWAGGDLKMPKGATIGEVYAISCGTADSCVAVGLTGATSLAGNESAEVPLAETWNGAAWSASRLPAPSGSHGAQLDGISCTSATACVASGVYNLANGRPAGFAEVLHGGTWTVYKPPGMQNSADYSVLQNVSCVSVTNCVAVGSYGIYGSPGGAPAGTAVAETWNGTRWSETRLPLPSGSHYTWLYDVSCVPTGTCVATGGRYLANDRTTGTLAETWTAGKWAATTPYATGSDPSLFSVSCTSATACLAVGGGDTASAHNGAFADSWNGRTWKFGRLPTATEGGSPNTSMASGVSCVSATDCVATGLAGPVALLAYGFSAFWNGASWRLVPIA